MKQLVLGTAGHIDHGKTTLVKALTGTDTDRLKEEKARGITIELGFAFLDLPSGQRLGIVDVPGHEKFVKNMVAGAAGIDMVALVIAADEGVMPQTREHLDICKLLGVPTGLVVLTKADMVDEDWLELVTDDVHEYVQGTFLEDAAIIPVSGVTGQGIDDLLAELDRLAADLEERPARGPFRLPVDRVFTMKGFGTVVTGTAIGGKVAVGDELEVYPRSVRAKVRGLQVHGQETKEARRGQRTAVNLQGVDKDEIGRGDVLSDPGVLRPSMWLDVEVKTLDDMPRPIKHRAPIRLHTGTVEIIGRIHFLDRDALGPGEEALCQVRLEEPVAVMARDRFVIRSYSPVETIAGGRVLHPHPWRHKRNRPEIMADLETLKNGVDRDLVAVHARLAGDQGITKNDLVRLTSLSEKDLEKLLADMLTKQELLRFDKESGQMLAVEVQQALLEEAVELLGAYHQANPLKPGMPREELRGRLSRGIEPKLFGFLLKKLEAEDLAVTEKEIVRLPGHKVRLAADDEAMRKTLMDAFTSGGLTPPTLRELQENRDKAQVNEMLGVLVNDGQLVKIKQDLYYHAPVLEKIKGQLVDYLRANERIGAKEFKELTGLTRKYLIPLLEYFDTSKVTMRVGDERILRGG